MISPDVQKIVKFHTLESGEDSYSREYLLGFAAEIEAAVTRRTVDEILAAIEAERSRMSALYDNFNSETVSILMHKVKCLHDFSLAIRAKYKEGQ